MSIEDERHKKKAIDHILKDYAGMMNHTINAHLRKFPNSPLSREALFDTAQDTLWRSIHSYKPIKGKNGETRSLKQHVEGRIRKAFSTAYENRDSNVTPKLPRTIASNLKANYAAEDKKAFEEQSPAPKAKSQAQPQEQSHADKLTELINHPDVDPATKKVLQGHLSDLQSAQAPSPSERPATAAHSLDIGLPKKD